MEHCWPDMVGMVETRRMTGRSIVRVIYHVVITGGEPEEEDNEGWNISCLLI